MAKIGQLLLSRSWISLPQLTRALKNQSVVGGRLGTCLLEMDALSEEQFAKGLAEQLGLPSTSVEQLHSIPEEVIGVLPAKVARRCHAVPFQLVGNRLDVAMLDPRNLAWHDEVAFASGRRVRVHVAPEIRIFEALERYYGEECPSRFTLLLDRLNRARYLWNEEKKTESDLPAPVAPAPPPSRQAPFGLDRFPDLPLPSAGPGTGPLLDLPVSPRAPARPTTPAATTAAAGGRPATESHFRLKPTPPRETEPASPSQGPAASSPTGPDPAPARPSSPPPAEAGPDRPTAPPQPAAASPEPTPAQVPTPILKLRSIELTAAERAELGGAALKIDPDSAPTTLGELESALEASADRSEVARLVLGFLGRRFERAALFQVARDRVSGWLAHGRGIDEEAFARFQIGFDQPSLFLNLERGNNLYLGPLPPMPAHRELARTWGGELPRRSAMLPIRLGERMVAVLYFDGEDAAWSSFGIDALARLRTATAAALERCILRRRARRA